MPADKYFLNHKEIATLARKAGEKMLAMISKPRTTPIKIYGVPRGGVSAAYAVQMVCPQWFTVVGMHDDPDFFVDDIIDSGKTMRRHEVFSPKTPFVALINKLEPESMFSNYWVVFPWEHGEEELGIEDNVTRLLQFIGEDPTRGGLLETPKRVAKAWGDWSAGYNVDIPKLLKTFEDGADGCDEMVVVKDLPFFSHCEHHLAPFFGTATIAYIPDGKIVGLSKLSRLLDAFAKRLQVQERLTNQIADALENNLQPKGVGVVIKARHLCMESRGISKQGHETITSALRGVMRDIPAARSEFLDLAR